MRLVRLADLPGTNRTMSHNGTHVHQPHRCALTNKPLLSELELLQAAQAALAAAEEAPKRASGYSPVAIAKGAFVALPRFEHMAETPVPASSPWSKDVTGKDPWSGTDAEDWLLGKACLGSLFDMIDGPVRSHASSDSLPFASTPTCFNPQAYEFKVQPSPPSPTSTSSFMIPDMVSPFTVLDTIAPPTTLDTVPLCQPTFLLDGQAKSTLSTGSRDVHKSSSLSCSPAVLSPCSPPRKALGVLSNHAHAIKQRQPCSPDGVLDQSRKLLPRQLFSPNSVFSPICDRDEIVPIPLKQHEMTPALARSSKPNLVDIAPSIPKELKDVLLNELKFRSALCTNRTTSGLCTYATRHSRHAGMIKQVPNTDVCFLLRTNPCNFAHDDDELRTPVSHEEIKDLFSLLQTIVSTGHREGSLSYALEDAICKVLGRAWYENSIFEVNHTIRLVKTSPNYCPIIDEM